MINPGIVIFLLRKAALIKSFCKDVNISEIDLMLEKSGLDRNNVICASLVHCYQEEPDYLTLKRSILNLPNQGASNRFTRDISRLPFHPHVKSEEDFANLLQSSLQSSLIDACFLIKVNLGRVTEWYNIGDETLALINKFTDASPSLNEISKMYPSENDTEDLFVKRASAWYECDTIVEARYVIDHFGEAPDSSYLEITSSVLDRVGKWLKNVPVEQLSDEQNLTRHNYDALVSIEQNGLYTRSAAFNYRLWQSEGYEFVSEQSFLI